MEYSKQTQRISLIVAMISSFSTPFLGSAINVALPTIGKELAMDSLLLSWVASAFLLATVVVLMPIGRLGDILGRKKIFLWGAILMIVGLMLSVMASTPEVLLFSRVVQGVAGAMVFGTSSAILTATTPLAKRGKMLGLMVGCVYFGGSMGPILGGYLVEHLGWRSLFSFNAILLLVVPILVITKLDEEWQDAKGERFDFKGSFLYALGIFGLMYGLSKMPSKNGLIIIVVGAILFYLFIRSQLKGLHPLLDVRLFVTNRLFAMSSLAALLNYSVTFAIGMLMGFYLQYIKGMSPSDSGLIMFIQPVAMTLFAPFAGMMSDKIEPRILTSAGMVLIITALLLLCGLTPESSTQFLAITFILLGAGFGLFSSPNTNAIMSSVEKKYLGIASSLTGVMRMIGQMTSMGIVMTILSMMVGAVQITPDQYGALLSSIKTSFIVFAVLSFVGLYASLARGNLR